MLKYVTIPDIRRYPSYRSINARLLYMHLAMSMDINSRTYAHSWRQLAVDLDMPLQQLRTALKQLEKDGLIATQQVTQTVTYGVTQRVTHKVTQIYIMSVSDLDEATNEATNSPTNSPTNSQTNSQTNSDNNNLNISNSSSLTHSPARVEWSKKAEELGKVLKIDAALAEDLTRQFRERQEIKGKSWENEGDLLAHLISWSEKRLPLQHASKKPGKKSDSQARQEEYQRDQEQRQQISDKEKDWEEVTRVFRWWKEAEKNKNQELADIQRKNYEELRQAWERKYQPNKAS